MGSSDTVTEAHAEIEEHFSEYYERTLPAADMARIEAHLAECAACRGSYDGFKETVGALAGMHRMSAPDAFDAGVADTIRRRSGGRFFGRKAFGDRVPFEVIAIVVLVVGLLVFLLLRASTTGSLRYEQMPDKPVIAPGAEDVLPVPPRVAPGP